jgi:hypothetical protein
LSARRRDGIAVFRQRHSPAISAATCSQMVKADGAPCQSRIDSAHPRRGRSAGTLFLQVVNLECSLLWRPNQSPFDTLLHSRQEDLVPKPLPALLGVVHGHNRPAARRRPSGVEDFGRLGGCSCSDGLLQAISRTGPSYRQEIDARSRRPWLVSIESYADASPNVRADCDPRSPASTPPPAIGA